MSSFPRKKDRQCTRSWQLGLGDAADPLFVEALAHVDQLCNVPTDTRLVESPDATDPHGLEPPILLVDHGHRLKRHGKGVLLTDGTHRNGLG